MTDIIVRLRKIRMLAMDVDGVMTDCSTTLAADGEWQRGFCIRDGYGIVMLNKTGYQTAVITASKAKDIQERVHVLGIHHYHPGNINKKTELEELLKKTKLTPSEVAYIGDDLFDIPVLRSVGFAATVPEAMGEVFPFVHYTTKRNGGDGAVREICDMILQYGPLGTHVWDQHFR